MQISFNLRNNNPKKDSNGKAVPNWKKIPPQSIRATFRVNGERFNLMTGKKIDTEYWSNDKQTVLTGYKFHKEYNAFLKDYSHNLEKLILDLQQKKVTLYRERLQEQMDLIYKVKTKDIHENPTTDFVAFMDVFLNAKKGIKGGTLTNYKQLKMNVILAFRLANKKDLSEYLKLSIKAKSKYEIKRDKVLDFDYINADFIEEFRNYMMDATYTVIIKGKPVTRNYKKNYIAKQVKYLKQFIRGAINKKLVQPFEVGTLKAKEADVDSVFTNYVALQKMFDLNFIPDEIELEETRDSYVANCFLGFRYSDFAKLEKHLFTYQTINGSRLLIYKGRNIKTDGLVEFAVHDTARMILEKYDFELPSITPKDYNENLKVIAKRAGLKELVRIREIRGADEVIIKDVPFYELVSSHTARRSFCTNFFNDGVNIHAIMSISGHKTEKQFYKYINKNANVNISLVAQQINKINPLKIVHSKSKQVQALSA